MDEEGGGGRSKTTMNMGRGKSGGPALFGYVDPDGAKTMTGGRPGMGSVGAASRRGGPA